ncbi:uncharacterized protein LOC101851160 [Aplysia californica]|uniref:Uncharacterized protein LOC101851160 n=1 Tax=Aplysia californica TaxID=6500 RepID=A0ABM0K8P7_APLCA|nr:uncharacterized protein LOC101851160 [Aplysia californica]
MAQAITFSAAVVVVFVLVLCVLDMPWLAEACVPVEEGKSHVWRCDIPEDVAHRDVKWVWEKADGQSQVLSVCVHGKSNNSCSLTESQVVTTVTSKTSQGLHSRMEVQTLSRLDHHSRLSCGVMSVAGRRDEFKFLTVFHTCEVSVFVKPRDPKCESHLLSDNIIQVDCSAQDVFPALLCDMIQIEEQMNRRMKIPGGKVHYTTRVAGTGYRQTPPQIKPTCSARLFRPVKGYYRYFVVMYPRVRTINRREMSVPVQPTAVNISRSVVHVSLSLVDSPVDICPEEGSVITPRCEATGFESKPYFRWTVFGKEINSSDVWSVEDPTGHPYMFISTHKIRVRPEHQGILISCSAVPSNWQEVRDDDITDSLSLQLRWPPSRQPEFFFVNGGEKLPKKITLVQNSTALSLQCSVPAGGTPDVQETTVSCTRTDLNLLTSSRDSENGGNVILRESAVGASANFTLDTKDKGAFSCVCSAKHATRCYHGQVDLDVTVVSTDFLGQFSSREGGPGDWKLPVIVSLFVTVAGLACCFVVIACRKLYNRTLYLHDTLYWKSSGNDELGGENKINSNKVLAVKLESEDGYIEPIDVMPTQQYRESSDNHYDEIDTGSDDSTSDKGIIENRNMVVSDNPFYATHRSLKTPMAFHCTHIQKEADSFFNTFLDQT